jgi:hypothetical protein
MQRGFAPVAEAVTQAPPLLAGTTVRVTTANQSSSQRSLPGIVYPEPAMRSMGDLIFSHQT